LRWIKFTEDVAKAIRLEATPDELQDQPLKQAPDSAA
jgi:hypothetical protein